MITIVDYLHEDAILFSEAESRDAVLDEMVDRLQHMGTLQDKIAFREAIFNREKTVSTGIGMGVAIPHAKLVNYSDFFIAIAIHKKGVEWNALDGAPVHLIFMIGGPENQQTYYLQMLSALTTAIRDEKRRKQLLKASTAQEVLAIFQD